MGQSTNRHKRFTIPFNLPKWMEFKWKLGNLVQVRITLETYAVKNLKPDLLIWLTVQDQFFENKGKPFHYYAKVARS